eukprot:8265657-Pyramimonas_sp.AAC.1
MGFFSKIQAVGYSSCMWGCCADESGIFMNVSSSARMATCPSVFPINTVCSMSRSDMALLPQRALTGLSVPRWLRGQMSRP